MVEKNRITITYFEYLVVQRKCLIKRYRECYILHGIGDELGRYVVVDRDRKSMWSPSQASVADCERQIDEEYPLEEKKIQPAFSGLPILIFFFLILLVGAWSLKS